MGCEESEKKGFGSTDLLPNIPLLQTSREKKDPIIFPSSYLIRPQSYTLLACLVDTSPSPGFVSIMFYAAAVLQLHTQIRSVLPAIN